MGAGQREQTAGNKRPAVEAIREDAYGFAKARVSTTAGCLLAKILTDILHFGLCECQLAIY